VDVDAARRVIRAAAVRTWGAFARVAGRPWAEAKGDEGDYLEELNDGVLPTTRTPFSYASIFGATLEQGDPAYWVSRWIEEPREAAVKRLEEHCSRLRELLERSGFERNLGSPMGHVESLVSSSPAVFELLAENLRRAGVRKVVIHRDDALVRRCLVI
jgi:hypothetical protein